MNVMKVAAAAATIGTLFLAAKAAEAGTTTAVGAVNALTNINQMTAIAGHGNFDEGPTSGNVPAGVYSSQGLTWQQGALSTILPGCTNTGSALYPQYGTWASFGVFPSPIGGGGSASGVQNNFAGVATFSISVTQVGLTASSNGTQYLTAFAANGSMIGQVTWTPSGDSSFIGIDTNGVPIAMIAYGNHDLWNNQPYGVGGATIISDSWVWGGPCSADAQCDDGNVCTTDICNVSKQCTHVNNANSCNDGNACTQTDTCQAGTCTGSNSVTCAPLDACHVAGTCNPTTGQCSNPTAPDGTACQDSNLCIPVATCTAGVCNGPTKVCPPTDQCHAAGTCDPNTGACSNPPVADGTTCNDNDACTQTDTCQAGTCNGGNPVTCTAADQCHDVGVCDKTTGKCSSPTKTDGSTCDDGNKCTTTDTCVAGTCTGANPVTCTASDQCHDVGTCDTSTGTCSNPSKADGATCDDNDKCTQTDTCQAGVCKGASPVTCTAQDNCHDVGTCDKTTGKCSNPTKADGTACTDNNSCFNGDSCQAGVCTHGAPVPCTAKDECHDVGTCDSTNGACSNPTKADGTPCSGNGTCKAGACDRPDAGMIVTDAGPEPDAGLTTGGDASLGGDAGSADTGASSGCGCRVTGTRTTSGGIAGLGVLVVFAIRRRRRAA